MLKNLFLACSITALCSIPANAQVYESFDSSSFAGSGIGVNVGTSDVNVNAGIGPGGINGNFQGNGYGGTFNNGNVSIGTDSGFGGTFNTGGGYWNGPGGISGTINPGGGTFSGPGGINGTVNNTGFQIGAGTSAMNGSTSGGFGTGTLGSSGDTGMQSHNSVERTRGYQTQESPTLGNTTRNNFFSPMGKNLNLQPCSSKGLAGVFGY